MIEWKTKIFLVETLEYFYIGPKGFLCSAIHVVAQAALASSFLGFVMASSPCMAFVNK